MQSKADCHPPELALPFLDVGRVGLGGHPLTFIFVYAVFGFPFVFLIIYAAFQRFDGNLLRAAAILGARPLHYLAASPNNDPGSVL
jgi:ABC-type spermidine/putrescine transport system permease subunit II